jgi:hypothetical protein
MNPALVGNQCKYCKLRANLSMPVKTVGYKNTLCAKWGGIAAVTVGEPAQTLKTRGYLRLVRG